MLSTSIEEMPTNSFQTSYGIIFSFLGCVVGTGNIWRFPRICAQNSDSEGSLVFLIVWIAFLFLWSSPMILIEYAIGRYTKNPPLIAFREFLGNKGITLGGWVTAVSFFIGAYYSCILGWCLYYIFYSISVKDLPSSDAESIQAFDTFIEESVWKPVLCHAIAISIAAISVIGGVKWIEKANNFLVPALLSILLFTFSWSLWRPRADAGIKFLFTPNWESFGNYRLWIDAISQNAFDTGAASGLFTAYACYLTRRNGIVRYSTTIPLINNIVSFICALTIFSTAFSTLLANPTNVDFTLTQSRIVEILQTDGKGSTGLTFVWIPVLFSSLGLFGRILCVLFFVCLSFAGVTSLISILELTSFSIVAMGVSRKIATPICAIVLFLVGLPSAFYIEFLNNQDFTWGFGLIVSGLFFQCAVTFYGGFRFRKAVINEYGDGSDWYLPSFWNVIVQVIAPIEAVALLIWWIYSNITGSPTEWYTLNWTTLMTTLLEWLVVFLLLITINVILVWRQPSWMLRSRNSLRQRSRNTSESQQALTSSDHEVVTFNLHQE